MFKVVPDQLRVSEGWVRCGQCSEIFDARQQLGRLDASGQLVTDDEVVAGAGRKSVQERAIASTSGGREAGEMLSAAALDDIEVALAAREVPAAPVQPFAAQQDFAAGPDHGEEQAALSVDLPSVAGPAAPADAPQVSFLRNRSGRGALQRPWVRAGLLLCSLILVVTLTLQIVVQERDRIAALYPLSEPALAQICVALGCRIRPLRQIELIAIDSSSLGRIRADVFRLNFVLKNSGPLDLATPAIELTLTDTQDQALLRRVLLPADFTPLLRLAAGSDLASSLALQLRLGNSGERVSGYRVLAFYP